MVDDVEVARRALETKRQALVTARRSVDLSKETLDLVRVQHDAGTATQLDLLQAQDALVSADVAAAAQRASIWISRRSSFSKKPDVFRHRLQNSPSRFRERLGPSSPYDPV